MQQGPRGCCGGSQLLERLRKLGHYSLRTPVLKMRRVLEMDGENKLRWWVVKNKTWTKGWGGCHVMAWMVMWDRLLSCNRATMNFRIPSDLEVNKSWEQLFRNYFARIIKGKQGVVIATNNNKQWLHYSAPLFRHYDWTRMTIFSKLNKQIEIMFEDFTKI